MKGFILFSVLLFLQIFTLLGLYGLTAVKSMVTESRYRHEYQINKANAKLILQSIEKYLLFHVPLCIIPVTPASILVIKDQKWWENYSCHGNFSKNQYDYVVELLGKDACTIINKHDNYHILIAEYYRISLLFFPRHMKKAKILLQSVIVKANNEITACPGERHMVALGCQVRHELVGRAKI